MVFLFTPGQALGCNVNAHRNGWSGIVCSDAKNWSCSADQKFRDDYCARGDSRCYHVHLFDDAQPRFQVDDNGIGWMLHVDTRALDDQILVVWGGDFGEPRGLRESRPAKGTVYGAYRVKTCRKLELPYRVLWEIVPHPDGWTRCHNLLLPRPSSRTLGGKYIREVDRSSLLSIFAEGRRQLDERRDLGWHEQQDAQRFRSFCDHLEGWLESGRKAAEARGFGRREAKASVLLTSGPAASSPFATLAGRVTTPATQPTPVAVSLEVGASADKPPVADEKAPQTAESRQPSTPSVADLGFVEPAMWKAIANDYGEDTLLALRIATLTKPLLVLAGNTGVGKSRLALHLLDDPKQERTLVVPVAATWRGREDLLGYVNPVTSEFEPTEFTRFLFAAWRAHVQGDRRPRLVVFEEFNLSQPEHWLSDFLAVSQYEHAHPIPLGGKSVRGEAPGITAIAVSPALRIVATINNDHTTRPLSPRVLDRAAIVELHLEARDIIRLTGNELGDDELLAITELDDLLQARSATFSLRSARSLKKCRTHAGSLGIDPWQALDMVLVQEVLSKVRLLARDPADAELLHELQRWSEKHGRRLARSARTIEVWGETLEAGGDVAQA